MSAPTPRLANPLAETPTPVQAATRCTGDGKHTELLGEKGGTKTERHPSQRTAEHARPAPTGPGDAGAKLEEADSHRGGSDATGDREEGDRPVTFTHAVPR